MNEPWHVRILLRKAKGAVLFSQLCFHIYVSHFQLIADALVALSINTFILLVHQKEHKILFLCDGNIIANKSKYQNLYQSAKIINYLIKACCKNKVICITQVSCRKYRELLVKKYELTAIISVVDLMLPENGLKNALRFCKFAVFKCLFLMLLYTEEPERIKIFKALLFYQSS